MTEQYEQILYIWDEPQPLVQVPNRLTFKPLPMVGVELFTAAVAQAMRGSLDRSDQKKVKEAGAQEAATRFLAEAKDTFGYEEEWWQLAYDERGELVGFVQPVIYPGCSKDGLEEATIYYIGVVPQQRGNNYIFDLLLQTTYLLQKIGVWRIYTDTDTLNRPMIQAFEKAGYRRQGEPKSIPL